MLHWVILPIMGVLLSHILYGLFVCAFHNKANQRGQQAKNYSLATFGSKTAYKYNGLKSMHPSEFDDKRIVQVNALIRHGTRSPDTSFSEEAERFRQKLQSLCPHLDFSLRSCGAGDKCLLETGIQEHKELGHRLRAALPKAFRRGSRMMIVSTDTDRTKGSAKAFLSTFTDDFVTVTDDSVRTEFFAECNKLVDTARKDKAAKREFQKFRDGEEMQKVLREVVSDNGLEKLNLTTKDITFIYKIAGYEVSAMQEGDALPGWLKVFRPEHLYVLEYLHDLKYWTKGNAFSLAAEKQSCPLWEAMLKDLAKAASNDLKLAGNAQQSGKDPFKMADSGEALCTVLWFGHAETLLPVVATLRPFSESVNAEGYRHRLDNIRTGQTHQLYRSSQIIPFTGNIACYLYHTPQPDAEPSLNDYCLEVRLNEQLVDIIPHSKVLSRPVRLVEVLKHFHIDV